MVYRQAHQGAANVAQQRRLVARLRGASEMTALAEEMLVLFEATQIQHEAHLKRLQAAYAFEPFAFWR